MMHGGLAEGQGHRKTGSVKCPTPALSCHPPNPPSHVSFSLCLTELHEPALGSSGYFQTAVYIPAGFHTPDLF